MVPAVTHNPPLRPDRDPELTAYNVVLREALEGLVRAIRSRDGAPDIFRNTGIFSLEPETAHAEHVLRMETGRHAQHDLRIHADLAEQSFILADWVHYAFYGTPRSPRGGVPSRTDVEDALATIQRLVREDWALAGLLDAPRGGTP